MGNEILWKVAEWALTHMLTSISRRLFSDKKIIERVRISLKGAYVCIPPKIPLVRMTLEIRNSLASSIELHSIQGDVQTDGYTLINNFTKVLNKTLEGHFDKDCAITLDLPSSTAKIVGNHRADDLYLLLNGELAFNALGRTLTKPIRPNVNADIDGSHGDKKEFKYRKTSYSGLLKQPDKYD